MNKRVFIILFAICLMPISNYSQELSDDWQKARYLEERGDYASAAAFYENCISSQETVSFSLLFSYANCLRYLYEYQNAEKYYSRVWYGDSLHYPDALYYMALMKKHQAEYDTALLWFRRYSEYQRGSALLLRRVAVEIEGCDMSVRDLQHPEECEITALPSSVNSAYSEFNAMVWDDTLYFSAMRPVTKNADVQWLNDFYRAQVYCYPLHGNNKSFVLPKIINHPQFHTANLCFNADGTRLYFTRSSIEEPADAHAEIWITDKIGGKWQKAVRLPAPVNLPNSVNTQPFVTCLNGREMIYFVSNREGGQGGMDIWYVLIGEDGSFSEAVNAGAVVNSPGNEVTPYYHAASKTLYFSSDWYAGMGGYDVFAVQGGLSAWSRPLRHLPPPLNSPANDVYFRLSESSGTGYFASNRRHAYALADPLCCNDIYSFKIQEKVRLVSRDTVWVRDSAARAAQSLLPLILYFHNDEPDPRSLSDTTACDYETAWRSFMNLQEKYEDYYAGEFEGLSADYSRIVIRRFFQDTLMGAYSKLQSFFAFLRQDLEMGHHVFICVDGHASPLHTSDYNMRLSSRRIQSLWNSLWNYDHGFFRPYVRSGQLEVKKNPKGKEEVRQTVSDNPKDKGMSVYSVEAALERRIQISQYQSDALGTDSVPAVAGLQAADTLLALKPLAGAGDYFLAVQVKNIGSEPLFFQPFNSDENRLQVTFEKDCIKPDEYVFVNVKCASELLKDRNSFDVVFISKSKNYTIKTRLRLLLSEQN